MALCPAHGGLDGAHSHEGNTMILNFVLWCLFGLIAGAIAQFLMPGKDPGQASTPLGFVITTMLGIIGAVAGGFLSSRLFNWDVTGFNVPSLAIAIGGALVLLVLYRVLTAAGIGPSQTAHRH
jgi:uncharacterized membrane protein YeaQ/YmgE (transglycosylase-associated protein family)